MIAAAGFATFIFRCSHKRPWMQDIPIGGIFHQLCCQRSKPISLRLIFYLNTKPKLFSSTPYSIIPFIRDFDSIFFTGSIVQMRFAQPRVMSLQNLVVDFVELREIGPIGYRSIHFNGKSGHFGVHIVFFQIHLLVYYQRISPNHIFQFVN